MSTKQVLSQKQKSVSSLYNALTSISKHVIKIEKAKKTSTICESQRLVVIGYLYLSNN